MKMAIENIAKKKKTYVAQKKTHTHTPPMPHCVYMNSRTKTQMYIHTQHMIWDFRCCNFFRHTHTHIHIFVRCCCCTMFIEIPKIFPAYTHILFVFSFFLFAFAYIGWFKNLAWLASARIFVSSATTSTRI